MLDWNSLLNSIHLICCFVPPQQAVYPDINDADRSPFMVTSSSSEDEDGLAHHRDEHNQVYLRQTAEVSHWCSEQHFRLPAIHQRKCALNNPHSKTGHAEVQAELWSNILPAHELLRKNPRPCHIQHNQKPPGKWCARSQTSTEQIP